MPLSSGLMPKPTARGEKEGPDAQAPGRSRGGFGTEIHVCVDALGLLVRILPGPDLQNGMAPARDLVDGPRARHVLADRAEDAYSLCDRILDRGGEPVIPPRRHRRHQHAQDTVLHKKRNRAERFFGPI